MPSKIVLPTRYKDTGNKFAGGLGEVFHCRDTFLERDVAIKFYQDGISTSFMDTEVKNLQSIRSKHVVEIYDLVKVPGSKKTGLVQEYLPGDDLASLVPDSSDASTFLPKDKYLKLIYQIASGLKDIHDVGVIHRDVKLNNMKLSAEGVVTLFDFGFAKAASDPHTRGFKGTFGYAAPELYGKPPVKVTKAVDVYAFGISAWFLAVGKLPAELRARPPTAFKSNLALVRADLPSQVAHLLDQCVAYDPASRPQMHEVEALVASHLVQGQHRGVLCSTTKRYLVNSSKSAVNVKTSQGEVTIVYTGLDFRVTLKSGDVFLNNRRVTGTMLLPGASVLVFGDPSLEWRRSNFTFDVSRPEVVL